MKTPQLGFEPRIPYGTALAVLRNTGLCDRGFNNNKIILPANNIRGLILFKIVFINNYFLIQSFFRKI